MKTENILNDSRLRALENHTRVNLLRPTMGTTTSNGVTCTNNGDGTYTLNGTSTGGNSSFGGAFSISNLKAGTYTLSNYDLNGNLSSIPSYVTLGLYRGSWDESGLDNLTGSDTNTFTISTNEEKLWLYIRVIDGNTVNNLVIRPMLVKEAGGNDSDFVSYNDSLAISGLKAEKKWTMVLKGTLSNQGIEYNPPSIYEEFMLQLGSVNGGQIFGGTNVVIQKGSNHPMFIPLYVNSNLYAVAYSFLNYENNVLKIDASAAINYEVWAR